MAHLQNSEGFRDLTSLLTHLSNVQQVELSTLVESFPKLFYDVPNKTMLLQHDIDVAGAKPVKQHA